MADGVSCYLMDLIFESIVEGITSTDKTVLEGKFSKLVAKSWREYRVFLRQLHFGPEVIIKGRLI